MVHVTGWQLHTVPSHSPFGPCAPPRSQLREKNWGAGGGAAALQVPDASHCPFVTPPPLHEVPEAASAHCPFEQRPVWHG